MYGEDGMDGVFIEHQYLKTCGLLDKQFEHNYSVDVTDLGGEFLPGALQVGINDGSLELQSTWNNTSSSSITTAKASSQ
jgi:DNA-directed RNA polymerase II subunit RPB1